MPLLDRPIGALAGAQIQGEASDGTLQRFPSQLFAPAASPTFTGDIKADKTITAAASTGAKTISKTMGTVRFAAGATSLVVTNTLVTANSIIMATVITADATMFSVSAAPGSGSFTLTANAAATAETGVAFVVLN